MKALPTKFLAFLLTLLLLFASGCSAPLSETLTETAENAASTSTEQSAKTEEEAVLPDPKGATASSPANAPSLNGWSLSDFVIVYSENEPDYTERAAEWLSKEILTITGVSLPVTTVEKHPELHDHEIVIGETNRDISKALKADTEGMQVSYLARRGHVAMEGDSFVIAAAAYRFLQDYIVPATATVPAEITVKDPVTAKPKNFVFLIGDGMGINQTKLFEAFQTSKIAPYTDGEEDFYGHLFPHSGLAITNSLSGTTDSAASGTALATGYKTTNRRIGQDPDGKPLRSLTEMASNLGLATAVMSTEVQTGATPSSFSAHAADRGETEAILASQQETEAQYGTIISAGFSDTNKETVEKMEAELSRVLNLLFADPEGSFLMFEEAYVDKFCHNNNLAGAYKALARFDQTIGLVMEKAFYHPETLVLITADHETGGLIYRGKGAFQYSSESHTASKVPIYAWGEGSEVFHQKTVENTQIPKTLAVLMGGRLAEDTDATHPPLIP